MRLLREIYAQLCEEDEGESSPGARYTVIEKKGGYFQNVKEICAFSSEKIILRLRRGVLEITGAGLYIKKYCENDALVGGEIFSVGKVGEERGGGGK